MKQKELSSLLKAIDVLVLFCLLFLSFYVVPQLGQRAVAANPTLGYLYWPCLVFFWITVVPVFISVWYAWCIFTQIGRNNSFSYENACHLKNISLLAAADSAFYLVGIIVLALMRVLHIEVFILLLAVVFIGVIASIITSALSHLTYKAAELKADSDLTI